MRNGGMKNAANRCRQATRIKAEERITSIARSEEHTSELQSLMRISYAVFCLKKKSQEPKTRQPISEDEPISQTTTPIHARSVRNQQSTDSTDTTTRHNT